MLEIGLITESLDVKLAHCQYLGAESRKYACCLGIYLWIILDYSG
jgi:hypothetical protein